MTQKEFVEKYVRTSTPVLIQGCNFNWLDDVDLDLPSATKVKLENHNIALKLIAQNQMPCSIDDLTNI